jgi:hypothetical protein
LILVEFRVSCTMLQVLYSKEKIRKIHEKELEKEII